MITDKRMSAARVVELRACHNPVFDELLDFVQAMSDEYQKWICELEGPTPAELQEKIKTLEMDLHAAIVPKSSYMELHAGFDIQSERLSQIARYVGATDYIDSIGPILDAIDKKLEDAPFQHQCVAGVFGPGCGARWTPSERPTVGVMRSFQLDDMEYTPGSRGQR